MEQIIIRESEMDFGPFLPVQLFHIEKSSQYQDCNRSHVRCCEFVLLKNKKILFVEAKKSCPNSEKQEETGERTAKYHAFISEITEKMRHSLALYGAMLSGRRSMEEVGDDIREANRETTEIVLVLVVKNASMDWLKNYADVFREQLRPEMRIWNVQSFQVINEEKAREKGLIGFSHLCT